MTYKFSSTFDSVTDAHIVSIEGDIKADDFIKTFIKIFSEDNLVQSTSFLLDIRKLIITGKAIDTVDRSKEIFELNKYQTLDIAILCEGPKETLKIIEQSSFGKFINCRINDNLDDCLDFLKTFKANKE